MYRRVVSFAKFAAPCPLLFSSFSYCSDGAPQSFSPKEFRSFPITKITQLSHDTKAYEIALPSPSHETGLVVSSLIMVRGLPKDGKEVARPYTPTSLRDQKGSFELVVKSYPTGNVSKYLDGLNVGDSIDVKGPYPKLTYTANMKKKIGMVAGGTGITPMIQIIKEILKNPDDKTEVHLIFANRTEDDILLKSTLDKLAATHRNFRVTYIVDRPTGNHGTWRGPVGYIDSALISSSLPPASPDTLIYVCGPPGFMKHVSGEQMRW